MSLTPTPLAPIPHGYPTVRTELQRVATHVLARARAAVEGRFGLRITPSGIATPVFGPAERLLRISGTALVHEFVDLDGPHTDALSIDGRTLGDLAVLAGVDLAAEFSVGHDTPAVGDASSPISIGSDAVAALLGWLVLGDLALNALLARAKSPSIIQLWPEHFDVAVDVATRSGRVNLGASPGDAQHPEPYLYVGPWGSERPGDPGYWNAPFGATLSHSELLGARAPLDDAVAFLHRGLDLLD